MSCILSPQDISPICCNYILRLFLSKPKDTQVFEFSKLGKHDQLVLGFYLAADPCTNMTTIFTGSGESNKFVNALHTLVADYVRAIIGIGIAVRHCHWKHTIAGTGCEAKKVIESFLAFRVCLQGLVNVNGTS